MILTRLRVLHQDMQNLRAARTRVPFVYKNLNFECMYLADLSPMMLVIGCVDHNFIVLQEVDADFSIVPFVEPRETFMKLRAALATRTKTATRVDVCDLFASLNESLPSRVDPRCSLSPSEVGRYLLKSRFAETNLFLGFVDNKKRNQRVSPRNLEKTRSLLGARIAEIAANCNLSVRWRRH
jgi:hypothetical protein